jgi:hypothetical protein
MTGYVNVGIYSDFLCVEMKISVSEVFFFLNGYMNMYLGNGHLFWILVLKFVGV